MDFETKDLSKLDTLAFALSNYFPHSLPNGRLYKNTGQALVDFLAPFVSALGASSYVPISGTVLPNPTGNNSYSIVGQGNYSQTGEADVVASGFINIISWNGTTWSLTKALNLDFLMEHNKTLAISKDFIMNTYNFEQGNYSQFGEENASYAIRSKNWYTLDAIGALSFKISGGYRFYVVSTTDHITFRRVLNANGNDYFEYGDKSQQIQDREIRIVIAKNDLSNIDVNVFQNIGAYIQQEKFASKKEVDKVSTDLQNLTVAADQRIKTLETGQTSINNFDQRLSSNLVSSKDFILNELTFEQGDFNTFGSDNVPYAIRSKNWFTLDVLGQLSVFISPGYRMYIISTSDFSLYNRVYNVNGLEYFQGEGSTKPITDRFVRIVIAKSDLSNIDVSAFLNIGAYVRQPFFVSKKEAYIQSKDFELIPRYGSEVEKRVITAQWNDVRNSRRLFDDQTGYFYQAGISYNGLFLFDTFLPIMALPEVFDYNSVYRIVQKFIDKADPLTGMFAMAINSNNTIHAYYSGADEKRARPCGEMTFWMPIVVEWLFDKGNDKDFVAANVSKLAIALDAIPRNSANGLVKVTPGDEWVPWGFQEVARFTGDVLNGSVFFWMGAMSLSRLYTVIGDSANSNKYLNIANQIKQSLGTSSGLWDGANGMFYAATGQNKQISTWLSALAVSCGLVDGAQATAISSYLVANYSTLTYKGYIRPSNVNWAVTGHLLADNTYGPAYTPGSYQDGYWSVANKWVLDALNLTSVNQAVQYAVDFLKTPDITMERWDNINNTPTVSGNYGMIVSPSGTLDFIRSHNWLF